MLTGLLLVSSQALYRLYHPECAPTGSCGISLQVGLPLFALSLLPYSQCEDALRDLVKVMCMPFAFFACMFA
jgi:hypothetical protein